MRGKSGLSYQAAFDNPPDNSRVEQKRWRLDQVHNLKEGVSRLLIMKGGLVKAGYIPVNQVGGWRFGAGDAGETKILAHGQRPGPLDDLSCLPKERGGQVIQMAGQIYF